MKINSFKAALVYLFIFCIVLAPNQSKAWGPEGHTIIARIAIHFVKDDVRKNVLQVLNNMSIDTAANWMDIMRSNPDYDFMKPWHYLDFPKGQPYLVNNEENILNRLIITYNELTHKKTLCDDQIKTDLLVLMHLMGDLHQPLHTGYSDDLGGNKRIVQYDTMKTHNLHTFWDEDIIRLKKITLENCLELFKNNTDKIDTIKGIDFEKWMLESKSLLNDVYNFPEYTLDEAYLNKNKSVVERQLLVAGLRLAAILDKVFYTPAPTINFHDALLKFKDGIDIKDALNHTGEKVTVCARVYGIKASAKITQIDLGDKYPRSPLTIVIFGENYGNFKTSLEDLYRDKNICVKGKIENRKGKAQIVIEKPDDIIIQ